MPVHIAFTEFLLYILFYFISFSVDRIFLLSRRRGEMDSDSEMEGRDGDGKRGWKEEKARCAEATLTTTIPRVQPPRPSPNRCIVFGSGGGQERRCFNCNDKGHIARVCTTRPHHPHHTRPDHHKLDEIKRRCAKLEEREKRLGRRGGREQR